MYDDSQGQYPHNEKCASNALTFHLTKIIVFQELEKDFLSSKYMFAVDTDVEEYILSDKIADSSSLSIMLNASYWVYLALFLDSSS